MTGKVLFVDDEPNVLAGFERLFRKDYSVSTAQSGDEGLSKLVADGPYHVVFADMRMPFMHGAEFLARVRELCPDTIRLVLTGETDVTTAMQAVNEGAIFRFLLKPCAEPTLRAAIDAALRQWQLHHAERQLLEQTLRGTIKVLSEVLSLVNPTAFGKAVRIQRYTRHITSTLNLTHETWQYDVAAMLSQIGCVTIPPSTLDAVNAGDALTDAEQQRFQLHASVAHDLLVQVPRLEEVAMMVCRQHTASSATVDDPVAVGAQILKVALAFDQHLTRGLSMSAAMSALRTRPDEFNVRVVNALASLTLDVMSYQPVILPIARLEPGMIIDQEVKTRAGLLLVTKGQETSFPMVVRLKNFHHNGAIEGAIQVRVLRPSVNDSTSPELHTSQRVNVGAD
jgi:YesN/AraC family two-component response regulator